MGPVFESSQVIEDNREEREEVLISKIEEWASVLFYHPSRPPEAFLWALKCHLLQVSIPVSEQTVVSWKWDCGINPLTLQGR